jgi:hypothetical protein
MASKQFSGLAIRSARAAVVLALATPPGGCAVALRTHYLRIAEGLSSPILTEGIRVSPERFSRLELESACRAVRPLARLTSSLRSLDLRVGDSFSLSTLSVVAVDAADGIVPSVPIAIEASDANPPVLALRSDGPDLHQGRLLAVGRGKFQVRVLGLCPTYAREVTVTGRVHEIPPERPPLPWIGRAR